jgi:transposase
MLLEVTMNNKIKKKRPNYTLEFKQDAAKLVIDKGYTHQQAADNLGMSFSVFSIFIYSR